MANLTLRTTKGSPLTSTELDNNFINLNTDIASRITAVGLLDAIKAVDGAGSGVDADLLDGQNATSLATANTIVSRDSSGNFAAAGITASSLTSTGGLAVTGSQTLVAPVGLSTTSGSQILYQRYQSLSSNGDSLEITNTRSAAGADWQTAGTRLQQKIDATWMSYIQFNGVGNNAGISIGTGQSTTSALSISEVFRINGAGNVGIGTLNPGEKLNVNSTASEYAIQWNSTGSNSWVLGSAATRAYIANKTTPLEALTILNNGNVGIGTSNPNTKLEVNGNITIRGDGTEGGQVSFNNLNNLSLGMSIDVGAADVGRVFSVNNNFSLLLGQLGGTGGNIQLYTEGGERIRISANGNVGIGTNTPDSKLDVNGIVTLSLSDNYIQGATTGSQVSIAGGPGYGSGGQIVLRGSTAADNPGGIDFVVAGGPTIPLTINNAGVTTVPTGSRIRGIDVGSIVAPGTVVQVQTAISNTDQTIASATPVIITGLSINFTPKFANSKIIITSSITSTATYVYSFGIFKDAVATADTTGRSNNNQPNMQVTGFIGWQNTSQLLSTPVMHVETAGSTAMRTYDIRATSAWVVSPLVVYNLIINNRGQLDMASISHMVIYEVAQ